METIFAPTNTADTAQIAHALHQFRVPSTAKLVSADGNAVELTPELFQALQIVADALANGHGVNIAPMQAKLTTQDAADFLGVSRPTFIKLMTEFSIPFELVGRHRRVQLSDLIAAQDMLRHKRSSALDEIARVDKTLGEHTIESQDNPLIRK